MHRTAVTVIAIAGLAACCGGPSEKTQVSSVAVAYERAVDTRDFAAEWKYLKPSERALYRDADAYAANERGSTLYTPPAPDAKSYRYTVEFARQERIDGSTPGIFYRVRVRTTNAKGVVVSRIDEVIGKYDGHWLQAGTADPNHSITDEDVK